MNDPGREETRAAWNEIAPGYNDFVTPSHVWLAGEGLRRAQIGAGMRFLDVAAGSGALSIPAAQLGAQVLATDQSPAMLEFLQSRSRKEGLNIETRVMDGHALELDDDSFDITGSRFGVMLFPDMPMEFREMARVVKPGGRVLMITFADPCKFEFLSFFVGAIRAVRPAFAGLPTNPPPVPLQLQQPERLRNELAAAGLKDIRVETVSEMLQFRSGQQLRDWLLSSNPIVRLVLSSLSLSEGETGIIRQTLDAMVWDWAGGTGVARLSTAVNIGVGTK